jgi:mycoredoxin
MSMLTSTIPSPFDYAAPHARVAPVTVYGRRWCAISQMARRQLDRMGVPYEYIDLDMHPDLERRLGWMTGGRVHTPVIQVGDQLLVQPTSQELGWALRRAGW